MESEIFLALSEYSNYANGLLISAVGELSDSEMTEEASPSHGSVKKLIRHMLAVEEYYLLSAQGRADEYELPELQSLEDLAEYWRNLNRRRRGYLSALSTADLSAEVPLKMRNETLTLPRYQLLFQGLTHSIHHRGELSVVLTTMGHPLPTLDSILYFVEESGQEWPYPDASA